MSDASINLKDCKETQNASVQNLIAILANVSVVFVWIDVCVC